MKTVVSNLVPHLKTALSGPLPFLEKIFLDKQLIVESWLREQWQKTPAPITCSVDIRNAGYKIAPVDTNLFPAGFNNLNRDFFPLCVQAIQTLLIERYSCCKKILLIPENHTRNPYYFQSLAQLHEILLKAGYEVRIGSLLPDLYEPYRVSVPGSSDIVLEPIKRIDNKISVAEFKPCLIILNNDLASGIPAVLQGISQPIAPALELGWATRLKSEHFSHYEQICQEFSQLIAIDPWMINPYFSHCNEIDFLKKEGEDRLMSETEQLLQKIHHKYHEYNIPNRPFVVIKADAGTYGMGVMMIHDAEQLKNLNRKQRTHMAVTKGNRKLDRVILQEGVYTFETVGENSAVAEPVVYLLGHFVVGGFYRVHKNRGQDENLNAPGMHFEPLQFCQACNTPDFSLPPEEIPNRFYAYGVIARLAALAAARENYYVSMKEQHAHE